MFYFINFAILYLTGVLVYSEKKGVTLQHSKLSHQNIRVKDRIYLIFSGLQLFLIMGLRSDRVGTDTFNYLQIYESIAVSNNIPLRYLMEQNVIYRKAPLWVLMARWISKLSNSVQIYTLFSALVIIVFLWVAIYMSKTNCRKAVNLFYLLFFTVALNTNRTFMALSITMFGYVMLEREDKIPAIISMVCATLIHSSAAIGIVFILVSTINFQNKMIRHIFIAIAFFIIISYNQIIPIFLKIFPIYDYYENVSFDVSGRIIVMQILYVACILYTNSVIRKGTSILTEYAFNINKTNFFLIIEVILAFVGLRIWYLQRVNVYLQCLILFQWPAIDNYKTRYRIIYRIVIWGMALFYFSYRLYKNQGNPLPYSFYWE